MNGLPKFASRASLLANAIAFGVFLPTFASPDLTLDERLRAQEAIERVYYSHQIGATRPFAEAVPRAVLEKKVRTYLKQSVALERFWNLPITAEALERERERIYSRTRLPERLREIEEALGDDPLLIQECFVRPVLTERRIQDLFTQRVWGPESEGGQTRESWWASVENDLDESTVHALPLPAEGNIPGRFSLVEGSPGRVDSAGCIAADRWDNGTLGDVPMGRSRATAVWTGREMIVWGGSLNSYGLASGGRYDPITDTWRSVSSVGAPSPRYYHTAVWTGHYMVIWGGVNNVVESTTGGRYDPIQDAWLPTMAAPTVRRHTAIWTGSRMIVFGGERNPGTTVLGETILYDPEADSWAYANFGSSRSRHTAVWTGSKMIVWGGIDASGAPTATGGIYNFQTNNWTLVPSTGAPLARTVHSAVWTGSKMIVWGGDTAAGAHLNSGGVFDPASGATGTWAPTSTSGAPAARGEHTAVWAGTSMIVWGGNTAAGYTNTGGRYDPDTNTWQQTTGVNAPPPRFDHVAIWTGTRMIVWGMDSSGTAHNTGGRYDPVSDSWAPTTVYNMPSARYSHQAVWTGNLMIIWGAAPDGGRYDPLTDSWTATSSANSPPQSSLYTAVWSGTEMIVWGYTATTNGGGRYNPISDSWTPVNLGGAPVPRRYHTAVWTGSRMLIWGGETCPLSCQFTSTGGSYDPSNDSWTGISTSGAPAARIFHTAVWTGSRMLVWGGSGTSSLLNDGSSYNPGTDKWTALPTIGAPSPRRHQSALWTGSRMIIWGGDDTNTNLLSGGLYDPAGAGIWATMSTTGAPPLGFRRPIWTGTEMIDWGADSNGPRGGRYDPSLDLWSPMSQDGAPLNGSDFTTVWTGNLMIVWGGAFVFAENVGGRYAPAQVDADRDGDGFTACGGDCDDLDPQVHPGAAEVCNGRDDNCDGVRDEGFPDGDADGYAGCGGDCNDSSAAVHPGAIEQCNGIDDNCDGQIDEGLQDLDGDGFSRCGPDCDDTRGKIHPGAIEICNGLDDNCSGAVDEGFDQDQDGFTTCAGDCNDADPQVWAAPPPVSGLAVDALVPTPLHWDDPAVAAGPGTTSDLVSGTVQSAGTMSFDAAVCLESAGPSQLLDTRPDPSVGSTNWYLARSRNSCGLGTYGIGSGGGERQVAACP